MSDLKEGLIVGVILGVVITGLVINVIGNPMKSSLTQWLFLIILVGSVVIVYNFFKHLK